MGSAIRVGLISIAFASSAFAADEASDPFSILVGGGISDNELRIHDGGTDRSNMVADRSGTYFIGFSKVPAPIFGIPFLRWSLEGEFTRYRVNKTVANRVTDVVGTDKHNKGNEVELGTEIEGNTAYLSPTISLFLGDPDGLYGYLGFGVGGGWSNLSGTYYVTDGAGTPAACLNATTAAGVTTNCVRETLDGSRFSAASNAIFGIGWGNLGIKYFRGGPTFRANGHSFYANRALGVLFYQLRF